MSLHQRQQQQQQDKSFADAFPVSPRIVAPNGFPRHALLNRTNFIVLLALIFFLGFTFLPWSSEPRSLGSIFSSSTLEGGYDSSLAAWKDYTLDQAVTFVAKNGTVIVCAVSQAYLPFLNNWLISVTRQKRQEQVLVIAEDYVSLYEVNRRWPGHAVLVPPALPPQAAHKFGSQGFFNFTSRRPRHLLHIIELGYSVLYNDVDMVWLADPFPYFKGNHDVYFMDDMTPVKPLNHSHSLPPPGKKGRTYICSCMIFLNPTPGAKLLMRKWIEELKEQPWSQKVKANDQPAFNWALNKTAGQVDVYVLDQAAFPTGGLYFKNKTWSKETKGMQVIIHNNYIIGFEKKTKRFKDYKLWLVDDHSDESPLGKIESSHQ